MTRIAYRIAFIGFAVVVVVSYAVLIRAQFGYGLEYDEAYLLNVVRNIAEGHGFVDDGVSYFTSGEPFHPLISTGPTMLLPAALAWKISGGVIAVTRLVPVAFFILYLLSTGILFFRWRGRWAALCALAAPLLLPILLPDLTNRSVMPGRFIGETAAMALLVLMALLLSRQRYAWAGVAGGLAIQTKLTFLVPVLVVAAVWCLGSWLAHRPPHRRSLLILLPGLVLPTLLFELYKLVVLGADGYANNIRLTREFTAFNTVALSEAPNAAFAKAASLTQLLSGPAIAVCIAALGLLIIAVLFEPYLRRTPTASSSGDPGAAIALVAALAGAGSLLAWWVLTSSQTSPRPAVAVTMLSLSLVASSLTVVAFSLRTRSRGRMRIIASALPPLAIALLIICTTYQGLRIARNDSGQLLSQRQQDAAAVIAGVTDHLPVDDFWTNPEFALLTGLPFESGARDNPHLLVYTSTRALIERGRPDATLFTENCGEVLYTSPDALVCLPRS